MYSTHGDMSSSRRAPPPPSTARSSRYDMLPPGSATPDANGPLTRERMQMEQIRAKLERAQQRLARQHAAQSATPGSSRYYPPNYTSAKARTPAPPVQSVKLEDFSLLQHAYVSPPPPSSTASGYLGVYPPQSTATHRTYADPYASQRPRQHAPPPTTTTSRAPYPERAGVPPPVSARPTRQSVPDAPTKSSRPSASSSSRHHRQQYPPELQYRSASRNTSALDPHQQGTPLSTSAPFLVYSTSRQAPPQSTAPVASSRPDRPREAPPSAMRSAMQPPPSSRVRFEGVNDTNSDPDAAAIAAAAAAKKHHDAERRAAAKIKERQREKEHALREMLRQERHKRSVSRDAAENASHEPAERTRRGSLPTPPKSEIDVSAFELATLALPTSPSAAATGGGRTRRNTPSVAAPPMSAIQATAFDGAPVHRRSSAADEAPVLMFEDDDEVVAAAAAKATAETAPAKRDVSSDDDEFTTPPTSPSSGASSTTSATAALQVDVAPPAPVADAPAPVASPQAAPVPDAPIAVTVRPAVKDYDDALFRPAPAAATSDSTASPAAAKKKHLSIWAEDDEDEIISSGAQPKPSPRHQQQQPPPLSPAHRPSPRHLPPRSPAHKAPVHIWDNDSDVTDDDEVTTDNNDNDVTGEDAESNQELSPLKPDETVLFKSTRRPAPVPEKLNDDSSSASLDNQQDNETPAAVASPLSPPQAPMPSNQVLSPVSKPTASRASAYGSRSRLDLRSRISAALQASKTPEAPAAIESKTPPTPSPAPRAPAHPVSEPRAPPALLPPRSSAAIPRPPNTTIGRPSVSRPRVPPSPPHASLQQSLFHPPPSSHVSDGQTHSRRVRHREPLELKRQLPPAIGILAGLSSGSNTFPLNARAFYEIEWRTGEFGFSFQRVYAEACDDDGDDRHATPEMYLRMLLDTDRGTCKSFHDVHVGDILIQIGDVKVSDLGFDSARDPGAALTKYFTELRMQTPMRLVFQRMEVLDWEGGVEL